MSEEKESTFEVVLKINKAGVLNISHPDGAENLITAIYYTDLAHQILLQKSVMAKVPTNPAIIPAHSIPKTIH